MSPTAHPKMVQQLQEMTCLPTSEYEQSAVHCRAAEATCSPAPGNAGTLLLVSQLQNEFFPR